MKDNYSWLDDCLNKYRVIGFGDKEVSNFKQTIVSQIEKSNKKYLKTHAHDTEDGYCCACDYDIAVMNNQIEIEKLRARIDETHLWDIDDSAYRKRRLADLTEKLKELEEKI